MSFGFGVGDFLAVSKLSIQLWRSFKDAPAEFVEVSRELSSINVMLLDIQDQAGSSTSLLNRCGADRKGELMVMRDNLQGTLEELQALHQKYRNMGSDAWKRVKFGQENLVDLRSKLNFHMDLMMGFMTSLTMASVGRMESMLIEVLTILRNRARGHGAGAESLLDAQGADVGTEARRALERELQSEGIPKDYIQNHMEDIMTLGELC